jgi:hypothetical protein
MFGFLTGKLKTYIIGALAVLLPILYVLGRRDQKQIQKSEALEDALETERDRADFYRSMEQHSHEIEGASPTSRDDVVKRLRGNGL